VINGEKAALRSKAFAEKRRRTLDALLKDMYLEHVKADGGRKTSDVALFLQVGEHLKLKKSSSTAADDAQPCSSKQNVRLSRYLSLDSLFWNVSATVDQIDLPRTARTGRNCGGRCVEWVLRIVTRKIVFDFH